MDPPNSEYIRNIAMLIVAGSSPQRTLIPLRGQDVCLSSLKNRMFGVRDETSYNIPLIDDNVKYTRRRPCSCTICARLQLRPYDPPYITNNNKLAMAHVTVHKQGTGCFTSQVWLKACSLLLCNLLLI